jgi:hypothetical protein
MRIFIAYVLVSALAFAQGRHSSRFQLLEPGTFHGQDVPLAQPAAWIGVYCKAVTCTAQPTTVRSTRVLDPLGDDEPESPTGTSIEVSTPDQPLFLVRGIRASHRPVPTFFVGARNMIAEDNFDFATSRTRYALHVDGKKLEEDELPKGSRLLLSNGSLTQELFKVPKDAIDPHIQVLWIGDLDGDGKPDLYLDASWHYNLSHKVLWLSSLAKRGEIVGQAAAFDTVGC